MAKLEETIGKEIRKTSRAQREIRESARRAAAELGTFRHFPGISAEPGYTDAESALADYKARMKPGSLVPSPRLSVDFMNEFNRGIAAYEIAMLEQITDLLPQDRIAEFYADLKALGEKYNCD